MDGNVWPLAHTEVTWNFYNKFCLENLQYSPTKILDQNRVDPKKPASFLSTLGLDDDPLEHLRYGCKKNGSWNHIMFTVGSCVDSDTLIELHGTELHIIQVPLRRDYMILVSGTIRQWYDSCILVCQEESSFESRFFMSQCFTHLLKLGYKELFIDYERISHSDKTIILRSQCT